MKRVVIITGASAGIGYATGKLLSEYNYKVYSLSRFAKNDEYITFLECDISNMDSVKKAFEFIYNEEKQIDVVINNSGYGLYGDLETFPIDKIKQQWDVNVFGLMNVSQTAKNYLKKQQGMLINVSSLAAKFIVPYMTVYASTKAAVLAYSNALKELWKEDGITVKALIIGQVKSNFHQNKKVITDSTNNPKPYIEKSLQSQANDSAQHGLSVQTVAQGLLKAINKPSKKLEIVVGKKSAVINFAYKFLTRKLLLNILMKKFG